MTEFDKQEPIAIIGAACRLPGEVSSLGSLWDMISHARTGHCKIPTDRWDADLLQHPDPDRKGTMAVKHGYFLQQDVSHFDAPFFSTTAKEAAAMDPMKRLLLEVSYESIENAGIPMESLMSSQTGCYVGCMTNDYELLSTHDIQDLGYTAATGNSKAMTANRVSWFFGLQGPSLTLDTACSSSLYALHLACQSLKLGEAEMALVAGVNLILYPNCMEQFSAIHMLSPEGISHSFDDRANGYGRGEGIGCLVVKRLSDALRDGDTIRAVIRHTGANADGKTPSITQPSSDAQADLIRRTYDAAGLLLTSTQYFEAHGTGTPVGDPIELDAIASTLGAARATAGLGPLYFGSIKPNVGHTEGCSGLAGVFKALLCLEKGMLVPTYGVETVSPNLKLADWNLALPPHTMRWPSFGRRRISVNSFGFGGANAHAILDDAYHYLRERGLVGNHNTTIHDDDSGSESGISMGPATPLSEDVEYMEAKQLFIFSMRDQAGIQRLAKVYANEFAKPGLTKEDPRYLSNLAYTLAARRSQHDFRTFAIASSLAELSAQLSKPLPKTKRSSRRDKNLIFVFTGQGAQWPAMGRQLLSHPVFEDSMRASQRYLKTHGCDWDVFEELQKTEDSNISLPEYSQTLCAVLQVGLVDLLRHWKIMPKATVGHSSGEIAAAYAASYITHSDAVKIAYVRGLCSASVTRKGAMLAAGISRAEALNYLTNVPDESAVVACINSPNSVTLSGDVDAIDALEKLISEDNKFARKLKVKTAYHSPHMRSVAQDYLERMGHISTGIGGETIMFSSLTGKLVSPKELNARYWVSNMCAPVEFSAAFSSLLSHTSQPASGLTKNVPTRWGGLVEVGPHSALQGPVQQNIAAAANQSAKDAPYVSVILRGKDANETALTAVGQLWALGINVDLSAVNGLYNRSSIVRPKALTNLPSYPWNHSRGFWHEANATRSIRFPLAARTDLLGMPEDLQNQLEPRWKNYLRISENPWIEDHKITGTILYPAAGMLVMALEGALQTAEPSRKVHGFRFRDVGFERGLVVTSGDETAVETRLSLLPHKNLPGQFQFTVFSIGTGSLWTKHCSGTIVLEYSTMESEIESLAVDPVWAQQSETYKSLCLDKTAEAVDVDAFYDHLESKGMEYGPLFRNVVSLTSVPSQLAGHGTVIIPDTKSVMPANFEYPHVMHPATMDAIFHLLLSMVNDGKPTNEAIVPYSIADMFVAAEQPQAAGSRFEGYSRLVTKTRAGREIVGNLTVSDETWSAPKLIVKGFTLRQVTSATGASGTTTEEVGGLKKCARVEWSEDLDFIRTVEDIARPPHSSVGTAEHLKSWLDRLVHKRPVGQVLLVFDDESQSSNEIILGVRERVGRQPGFKKVTAMATNIARLDTLRSTWSDWESDSKLWDAASSEDLGAADVAYDLILVLGSRAIEWQSESLAKLQRVLSHQGHLVICPTEGSHAGIKSSLERLDFTTILTAPGDLELFIAVKTVPAAPETPLPSEVYFLLPSPASAEVSILSSAIAALFSSFSISVHSTSLTPDEALSLAGKHVISFLEAESPLIYSWNEEQFTSFKSLVSTANHLLWITRGGIIESWAAGVEFAPAQGLLRVMRNEYPLATLPHLDLSATFDLTIPASAGMIFDIWKVSLAESAEMEYAEHRGAIHIPRAVEDAGFDGDLQLASGTAKPVPRLVRSCGKAMKLSSVVEGGHFLWVQDEAIRPLESNYVEVEVEFVGLRAPASSRTAHDSVVMPNLAHEAVGVVSRCGSHVKSVVPGQRVVVFGTKACKTHIRQEESLVAAVPAGLLSEEAAALPGVFVTAQYVLVEIAGLSHGQTVLIHNAASALGQAAVQVSQVAGVEVFALVESKTEKSVLVERYGIPPTHIFDSNRQHFVPAVDQATNSRGVDVVLCSRPGPAVLPSLATLGNSGYFFDLGASNADSPQVILPPSKHNASLIRVDMNWVQQAKAHIVKKLFQRTFDGPIAAIHPTNVFSVSNAKQAMDALNIQQHGTVVLSIDSEASVLTLPPPADRLHLDEGATYVLAGGLGVLGLNIANMMADHGAKHLVFLSRSGGSKNEEDLKRFRHRGVLAEAFKCDVSDVNNVAEVFNKLRSEGRLVKGLIQCAMVLEDTIFDNMTHKKWSRAFQPKTRGSRNLLAQLSSADAPFFILLSSITGIIGNTAQANYASGNTFEDALAHYARKYLGIAATSIDVGLVSDSSHFTAAGEFGDLKNYLHRYQHGWAGLQCTLEELGVALQAIMRGSTADGHQIPAQVVLGLGDRIIRADGATGFERDRKFDLRIVNPDGTGGDGTSKGMNVGEKLSQAMTLGEATAVVEESFKIQIAAAFGVEVEEVDGQKALPELGVDSLKAVEMRNRVLKEMQSDISVFELLSATPLTDIAAKIAARSGLVKLDADKAE